jgi:hypothetical protein
VIDHTIVNSETTSEQRRPARQTGNIGRMHVIENGGVCSKLVDIRAGVAVIAVTAEMVGPQRIDVYIENAHRQ